MKFLESIREILKQEFGTRPAVQPGDRVEWMSPALPRQEAEVLAVYEDGTFEAFHPLTEIVCRMPTSWITRVVTTSTNPEGPTL